MQLLLMQRFSSLTHRWSWSILATLFKPFSDNASTNLWIIWLSNVLILSIPIPDTMFFQKRVVCTFYIHAFVPKTIIGIKSKISNLVHTACFWLRTLTVKILKSKRIKYFRVSNLKGPHSIATIAKVS